MMKNILSILLFVFFSSNSTVSFAQPGSARPIPVTYDMRDDLVPKRLTIAMWDYSWLNGHYPGGSFENFDRVTDELLERGFNTVRIDAFPFVIHDLQSKGQREYMVKANPLMPWGLSTIDYKHDLVGELIDFMTITKKKGIFVILSSWDVNGDSYSTRERFSQAWKCTLDILKNRNLLGHVLYVDLDQEFPNFSPFKPEIYSLNPETTSNTNPFDIVWNDAQLTFLRNHITGLLHEFQYQYPELRFTFSFVTNFDQFRALNLTALDVLEFHTWMDLKRFNARTGFFTGNHSRDPKNEYRDYMQRITATMHSIRPMLLQNMHNQLRFAQEWSLEIGAPLVTTEAWGPWWHTDHPQLDWKWLYDWCEQCMNLSSQYGFWGSTPWNFSHPYWENWKNIDWYCRVNGKFLEQ